MAPLAELEKTGLTATDVYQARDTGWSAAGVTASYCGVPLSSVGLGMGNHFGVFENFMPSATCFGDILKRDGYNLTLFTGAEKESAAFNKIFGQHGFDNIIDFPELLERYPADAKSILEHGRTTFGSHDDVVFRAALDELKNAHKSDRPFSFTIMTMGGHAPYGNLSPSCHKRPEMKLAPSSTLKAIYCTNLIVSEFIETARKDGLLENTLVVIQSDHLSMKNEIFHELKDRDRSNFLLFTGPGIKPGTVNKPATMLDVFPSILQAMGYTVENGRIGLGVSLFTNYPTLITSLGEAELNNAIKHDGQLKYRLWGTVAKSIEPLQN